MKKNKISVLGMLAMVLAFSLILAGCAEEKCPDGGTCRVNATWNYTYEYWRASGTACSNKHCFATRQKDSPGGVAGQDNIEICSCE